MLGVVRNRTGDAGRLRSSPWPLMAAGAAVRAEKTERGRRVTGGPTRQRGAEAGGWGWVR